MDLPNARDRNHIDQIIINDRYKGSLMDTREMKGADANSDHHKVMGKVRLKLCSTKWNKERTTYVLTLSGKNNVYQSTGSHS